MGHRMTRTEQPGLFGDRPAGPEGFGYWRGFLSEEEERDVAGRLAGLPLENFQFHGHRGEWEHSIPPVEALRYSITFRNMRAAGGGIVG